MRLVMDLSSMVGIISSAGMDASPSAGIYFIVRASQPSIFGMHKFVSSLEGESLGKAIRWTCILEKGFRSPGSVQITTPAILLTTCARSPILTRSLKLLVRGIPSS